MLAVDRLGRRNSTGLNANSVVYQSQFVTSDLYQDWTGNLFACPINPTAGVVNTCGQHLVRADAVGCEDAGHSPLIATWDPVAKRRDSFRVEPRDTRPGIGVTSILGPDLQSFAPDPTDQDAIELLARQSPLKNSATAVNSAIARISWAISSTAIRPTLAHRTKTCSRRLTQFEQSTATAPAHSLHRRQRRHAACVR